jgi:hypothetical protein
MERFYYKSKDGTGFLNLKSPLVDENYIQITEEEFKKLTKPKVYEPTAEQKATQAKAGKIAEYKKYLQDTDYIVLKIAEAQSESGDITALRTEYAEQLAKRKEARNEINKLEVK